MLSFVFLPSYFLLSMSLKGELFQFNLFCRRYISLLSRRDKPNEHRPTEIQVLHNLHFTIK